MTHTDRDKVICEALGIFWHDVFKGSLCCAVCREYRGAQANPHFSDAEGMLLILQKGPEREWWHNFYWHTLHKDKDLVLDPCVCGEDIVLTEYIFRVDLLQDPDKLADELYQFLKEGGR